MMNQKKLIIAVDGHASSGKSTLAKGLARELDYVYVDTGAMYRSVTLYCLQQEVDWTDLAELKRHLEKIDISFRTNEAGESETYLNGENVEEKIRSMKVSRHVSEVSAIREVREFLVRQQREMGEEGGIVMDGRDIGTVVFPKADLKLFITADFEERVRRRCRQFKDDEIDYKEQEVRKNLEERDYTDTHREESPLRKAPDAVEFDNTNLTPAQQLEKALQLVNEHRNS